MLFVIALFQPVTKKILRSILKKFEVGKVEKIDLDFIEPTIEILIDRDRIEFNINEETLEQEYTLSNNGHYYVYEKLISELNVKKAFSEVRTEIIGPRLRIKKFNINKKLGFLECM
jgi:hypothetical protein